MPAAPRPLLIAVVGPTSAGKSALALRLAERHGTELLSADSRQIYRRLNIGTNKPSPGERMRVPHHFVDELELADPFNAGRFEAAALARLEAVFAQHPVAVLAGGTGLYVRALLRGFDQMPAIPAAVRRALEAEHAAHGLAPLLEELRQADPATYETVDRANPQRVRRALEVVRATGEPFSSFKKGAVAERPFRTLLLGLAPPREVLYARINERVLQMMAQGLLEEVRGLLADGYGPALPALQTIGYKEIIAHLQGGLPLKKAVAQVQQATRNYAKRQLTWFRAEPGLRWFERDSPLVDVAVQEALEG